MQRQLQNADGLILEANYDPQMLMHGPYPGFLKQRIQSPLGHLSNQQAGEILLKVAGERTKMVLLAHLSNQNNSPETAKGAVLKFLYQARLEDQIEIHVAPRQRHHRLLEV